jgi:putative membrane protein
MRRLGFLLLLAPAALAHNGVDHATWSAADVWNALTAIALFAVALVYALGVRRLWRNQGGHQTISRWRACAFALGCAAAAAALLGPLDRWSDVLFSAHMAQHEILMLVSAPLMVLGRPFIASLFGVPPGVRDAAAGVVRQPLVTRAWELATGAVTVLLLHNESVHVVQHLGFFLTAALFWWALIHGRYGRLGYGIGVMYVFATAMHTQILGALLTFGSRTWYPTHTARTAAAGMNAVRDQQLAGIVMWIPFGVVFLFVGLALFAAWLGEAERRVAFTSSERMIREGRA